MLLPLKRGSGAWLVDATGREVIPTTGMRRDDVDFILSRLNTQPALLGAALSAEKMIGGVAFITEEGDTDEVLPKLQDAIVAAGGAL